MSRDTLELALEASGCNQATVIQKPRLLSDNGSSYVAADLADYLEDKGMDHVRGAPHHPQTQGKIERWHQTMKNRVLLENYFLPGDLERQIGALWTTTNNRRYHESLSNLTPADVYHGRGAKILKMREEIKKQTIRNAGCSTKPLPPKLKQKSNQSLRYETAKAFRKTLTTDSAGSFQRSSSAFGQPPLQLRLCPGVWSRRGVGRDPLILARSASSLSFCITKTYLATRNI